MLIVVLLGCRREIDPRRFLNEKPDLTACKRDATRSSLPMWSGGAIEVGFLARAPHACPAPEFPLVFASGEGRWIQIVTIDRSSFVDLEESLRSSGEPFVNATGGDFWDNPVWAVRPERDRQWRAHSYLVSANDRSIRALGGFSWGWSWRTADKHPEGVAPEPLARDVWLHDLAILRAKYPGWHFE